MKLSVNLSELSVNLSAAFLLLAATPAIAQSLEKAASHPIATGAHPAAASTKTDVHVVFDATVAGEQNTSIFHCASNDYGKTWTAVVNIAKTPNNCTNPAVAVEDTGALDVVWSQATDNQTPDIFFARSIDDGVTWTTPKVISATPGISTTPRIAIGPDSAIHVVWCDTSKGTFNQDIYYTSSSNHGQTWAVDPLLPAQDISNSPGISSEPDIAVDREGTVHVAWVDTTPGATRPDIFYVRRKPTGWTGPANVSNSTQKSTHPSLACGKGWTYLCWSDNSRKENAADIWLDVCKKSGRFSKPINISNTLGTSSQPRAVADDRGKLAIAWSDTATGADRPQIFTRVSLDESSDFSNVMDLSKSSALSINPAVTLVGKRMVVVWQEGDGPTSVLKASALKVSGIATGPANLVDPSIIGLPANMH